jgi:prefoldin subunit 5
MEKTTTEKQIENLSNAVSRYDDLISKFDTMIDLVQRRRIEFIEQRAQLNVLRNMLMPRPVTKEIATIIGTGAAVGYFIDSMTDAYGKRLDKENAKIEQELKEQKEWFDNVHSASSGH